MNIAEKLKFCDLKNFRLINKTANIVASSILLREDLPVVNLTYSRKCNQFFSVSNRSRSVDDLVNVIEMSKRFPCSSYSFAKANFGCEKLHPLFKLIGPHVKSLFAIGSRGRDYWCAESEDEKTQIKMRQINEQEHLVDLLLNKLPKLETLHIGGFNYEWIRKDDTGVIVHDRRITLPTLKFLHCINNDNEDMYEDGLEMLACAPLLKEIHGYKNKYFNHLGSIVPIDAIKSYKHLSYNYWYEEDEIFENLTKFANAGPMLNDFKFHLYIPYHSFDEEYPALMKILESSQKTLKSLRFNDDAIPFDFPVFTSLKNLTIDVLCNGNGNLWDGIKRFTKKEPKYANTSSFPSVETFTMVFGECWENCWYELCFIGSFFEVKTLNIIVKCGHRALYDFGKKFPNIKTLRIEWSTYLSYLSEITEIWEFLEEIEFIGLNVAIDTECNCGKEWLDEIEDIEVDENIDSCLCIKRFIAVILKSKCKSFIIFSDLFHLIEILKDSVRWRTCI